MSSLKQIRSTFLDYFAADGHVKVHSAPLVPQNDPTLLFVNAGMVPFKDYFTGAATPPYPRATSSQKCVRAGGKHNDLENVGYTARHHTFFEMLGNFSFGDYFKEQAITHAWTLLTREWGLAKDKLLVTVYHTDDEAADIWKKVAGFSDSKVIRIPTDDNFWRMGPTGPCGPCTEIFFDHGESIWGGPPGSAEEAALVPGVRVVRARHLIDVVARLRRGVPTFREASLPRWVSPWLISWATSSSRQSSMPCQSPALKAA